MDFDKYLEGQSMQRPPLFESDSFIYWKNRFETYVKSKDLDLWHVITNGDFQPIQQNPKPISEAKKESSDEECLTFGSEDKEYIMAVRDFKKFFRIRGRFVRQPLNDKKTFQRSRDDKNDKGDRKCFRCGDPNHLIGECPKPSKDKNQRAFVGGSWSDSGEEDDEKIKDETCLVAQASIEVFSESSYFSDENSSIDDLVLDNEYDKLYKMSLKIITKNKRLKATRNSLEKELGILKEKVSTLEKNKGVDLDCICLGVDLEPDEWIKDSGCSKHMTGNRKLFSSYKAYNGGNVIFGSNLRGNIIGKGTISNDSLKIDNVEHVDNLRFNLLSVRQICDNKCSVTFSEHDIEITKDGKVIGRCIRKKGLYVMKLGNKPKDQICLATINENSMLWPRRLGHTIMRLIQSLASKELVRNLPKLKFDQHLCDACKIGKQAYASHKAKNIVSTTRCLELLHMDLFSPSAVRSYGGNRYTLVIVDDYYRYTSTRFLKDKIEAFDQFERFSKKIQNQLGCTIVSIKTDYDREFDNEVQFGEFCNANGITHNFSAPRTPQSNGAIERKNRTLQEMSRTMLNEQSLPQKFWCNAIDTSIYILNRILIRAILGKTPYELLRGRKPTLDYFRVFGSKCFILNTKDYLAKFDPKSYEGVVLDEEEAIKVTEKKNLENDIEDETLEIDERVNIKESRNHPLENLVPQPRNMAIIGTKWVFRNKLDKNVARLEFRILLAYACALDFKLFQIDVKSAFLNGFINEEVYVAQPPGFIDFEKQDHVYKLKKALYGLKQAPKVWYDRLKAFLIKNEYKIGMVDNTLFTKKKSSNIIIVQIYVDDIILGSTCQDMCDEFAKIMHDEFEMSMMGELNFFLGLQIKQMEDGIFFNQSKYIKEMLKKFGLEESKPMKTPMSSDTKLTKDEECESVDSTKYQGMIGSLLYLTASRPDIMFSVCLCARFQEAPKTSHLEAVKRIFRYIKGTTHLGLWYPKGTGIETVVYADSDHAGDYVDRKSTSGICTFVGCCLTSWFSKKQTALAISTTKAEYVSAEKACQQAL
ncbi:retrovirus-related pol polyprotein from transposon TNT 1-94 [Tanacetum coccineum]